MVEPMTSAGIGERRQKKCSLLLQPVDKIVHQKVVMASVALESFEIVINRRRHFSAVETQPRKRWCKSDCP